MAKIKPELEQQLRSMPNRSVDLIVRIAGDSKLQLEWLASNGIQVRHQFRLTPGVAITCTGQAALKLLDQDWVVSIEPDTPVTTMGR
jgi:hypothetical protein